MRPDRNDQICRMLMNVCWLVVEGLLQTQPGRAYQMSAKTLARDSRSTQSEVSLIR